MLFVFLCYTVVQVFYHKQIFLYRFLSLVLFALQQLIVASLEVLSLVVRVDDACTQLIDLLGLGNDSVKHTVGHALRKHWVLNLLTVLHDL